MQTAIAYSATDGGVRLPLWGRYLAKWRPNTAQPALVTISVIEESAEPKLSIVVKIDPEKPKELVPVGRSESPWDSDGIVFGELCEPEDYSSFNLASQAYDLLPNLIKSDLVLVKYLNKQSESFCQDGSYTYGDPFDF